jgi:hypothetical protein
MTKSITLSVPQPCSQKWAAFEKTPEGGYCASCCKVVVDLSLKSDEEILKFFTHRPAATCARLRPDQLKTYTPLVPQSKVKPGLALLKAGFVSLLLFVIDKQAHSQNKVGETVITMHRQPESAQEKHTTNRAEHTIRGLVKSEDDSSALPGVNVLLKGTEIGTVTYADGRFELNAAVRAGDLLIFSFIGFRSKEYVVPKWPMGNLEIVMTLDMDVMGEVAIGGVYQTQPSRVKQIWTKLTKWF